MQITEIHVFDFDGTIIDSSHRYHSKNQRIDLPFWSENRFLAMHDSFLPSYQIYCDLITQSGKYVIGATSRTMHGQEWLFYHTKMVKPHKFFSRNEGDNTKGWELKVKWVKRLLNLRQFKGAKVFIWEDNIEQGLKMAEALKGHLIPVPSTQGW